MKHGIKDEVCAPACIGGAIRGLWKESRHPEEGGRKGEREEEKGRERVSRDQKRPKYKAFETKMIKGRVRREREWKGRKSGVCVCVAGLGRKG